MVSAFDSGSSGLGSSPGQDIALCSCVVFLFASHPGVYVGTGDFNAVGNPAMD